MRGGEITCARDYVPPDDDDYEGDLGVSWLNNPMFFPAVGVIGVLGGVLGAVATYFTYYRTRDMTFPDAHNPDIQTRRGHLYGR